jgi:pimeloyl-ACP methyl ester carboxylesterase
MKYIHLLFVCFVFFTNCQSPKNQVVSSKILKDIPYATTSPAQKLDVYLAEDSMKKSPVIISIHGGAFKFGDKADDQVTPMLEGLKKGYAIVSINYRLSQEAKFPAQIQDVKAAIRWVKANAEKYHFDKNKIVLWGGSAGGYLSALAGVSNDVAALEDFTMGNENETSKVQVVVDWFGPIDFLEMDNQFIKSKKGEPDHNDANSPESELLGQKITEIAQKVAISNPETYISTDDCFFFIQHGTADKLVPTEQSIHFAQQLEAVLGKEKIKIELLENASHGDKMFGSNENLIKVFDFLEKKLN